MATIFGRFDLSGEALTFCLH